MKTIGAEQIVTVGSRQITAHELTFSEVRSWFAGIDARGTRDPLHAMAFDDLGLDDLARMCDATEDELEIYTPSQLAPLVAACRALNPFFLRVRAALNMVTRRMISDPSSTASTATPPS